MGWLTEDMFRNSKIFPEDTLHQLTIYLLTRHVAKLERRLRVASLVEFNTGGNIKTIGLQEKIAEVVEAIKVLEEDRSVKSKRARIRLV